MISIGEYNILSVKSVTDKGTILTGSESTTVLLPAGDSENELEIGKEIEVFVYETIEGDAVATTARPTLTLNKFALLKAKSVSGLSAFMDWGLNDIALLIPYREQYKRIVAGESYVVYLHIDRLSKSLLGSTKVSKFLETEYIDLEVGQEVDLLAYGHSDLGVKVIINHKYEGLLYKNDVFQHIKIGEQLKGYIKKVRDDDKVDVTLHKFGYRSTEPNANKIMEKLKENDGVLHLHDKSDPVDITALLQMSKKSFKKAIGLLYKEKVIRLEDEAIYLNEEHE